MDFKSMVIRFFMLSSWIATISLSLYLTIYRQTLNIIVFRDYMLLLLVLGILSTALSLIYMKYVSPLSSALEEIEELKE